MEELIAVSLLAGGFAILLVGGEALVKASVSLALRWKISPSLIGLTIIAAGTSAPELMTSLAASFKNTPDIALGNVVGSNIFNILAILGLASMLKPNKVESAAVRYELPFLMLASILLITFGSNGWVGRYEGIFCLISLTVFIWFSIWLARKKGYQTEAEAEIKSSPSKNIWWDLGHLILGLAALLGGAHIALEGGIQLGQLMGLSERIIGVTIISVGTGLPELATSTVAAYRGRNDIAVSNVLGSNIFNTLAIPGAVSVIEPLKASNAIIQTDSVWMMGATFVLFPIIYLGRGYISRVMGTFLLFLYVSYIGFLLTV